MLYWFFEFDLLSKLIFNVWPMTFFLEKIDIDYKQLCEKIYGDLVI